jgi:hypothetical protein
MPKFRVRPPDGINLRAVPTTVGNQPLTVIPVGTIYERGELSNDGKWAKVHVTVFDRVFEGWATTSPKYSEPVVDEMPLPQGLSDERFSIERRRKYVDSILQDPEKFNFLRKASQAWDGDRWSHAFIGEDGKTHRVSASWHDAKQGVLTIVSPTAAGKPFGEQMETFCNFNVSFCYHQAYGGPCLQFLNGTEHTANKLVDLLTAEWKNVTPAQAARIANAGGFVIAGKKETGHGHVVFLLEGSDESGDPRGINTFHVGGGLPRLRTIDDIWHGAAGEVHYVVPPDTFAEFTAAGGG